MNDKFQNKYRIPSNRLKSFDYGSHDKTDWIENKFGSQSGNFWAIIRGFKSSVKRYANANIIDFERQPRYRDRIIRDDNELRRISGEYIISNPRNGRMIN